MNPKVARFFPLAIPALIILRELAVLVIDFRLDIAWYLLHIKEAQGMIFGILALFAGLLKILLLLGGLFLFKLLTDGKIKSAKIAVLALSGIYIFQGLLNRFISNYWRGTLSSILGLLIFIAFVVSLVIVLNVKDPEKKPRSPRVWPQAPAPMQFTPQSQNFNHVSGQSMPDQLAALDKLHASGSLTDAEFKAAKKKILE